MALNFEISPTNYQKLILQNELLDFKASACEALFPKIEKPLLSQEENKKSKKKKSLKSKSMILQKIEIKVAKVIDCQNIEGSEKLFKI